VIDRKQRRTQRTFGRLAQTDDRAAVVGEDAQHAVERVLGAVLVLGDEDEMRGGKLAHEIAHAELDHRRTGDFDQRLREEIFIRLEEAVLARDGDQDVHAASPVVAMAVTIRS
jgi:hypothetical protein